MPGFVALPGGRDVPEEEQQRHVQPVAAEARAAGSTAAGCARRGWRCSRAATGPPSRCPTRAPSRRPRARRRATCWRHLVDAGLQLRGVGEDQRVRRDRAGVLQRAGLGGDVDVVAGGVLLEGRHVEVAGQREDVVLGRAHERPAGLDHRAAGRAGGSAPGRRPGRGPRAPAPSARPPDAARGDQARRCRRRPPRRRRSRAARPRSSPRAAWRWRRQDTAAAAPPAVRPPEDAPAAQLHLRLLVTRDASAAS